MSITSAIGLERSDGTVDAIYCDNDSYLAGVGLTLADDYTTLEKVAQLMDLGNLSRLGSIPEFHQPYQSHMTESDANQAPLQGPEDARFCLSYRRDYWGKGIKTMRFKTARLFTNRMLRWPEVDYLYIFRYRKGEWAWSVKSTHSTEYEPYSQRVFDARLSKHAWYSLDMALRKLKRANAKKIGTEASDADFNLVDMDSDFDLFGKPKHPKTCKPDFVPTMTSEEIRRLYRQKLLNSFDDSDSKTCSGGDLGGYNVDVKDIKAGVFQGTAHTTFNTNRRMTSLEFADDNGRKVYFGTRKQLADTIELLQDYLCLWNQW